MTAQIYTTQLQAGLGMIAETRTLLGLWTPGMSPLALNQAALESGQFPNVSARRLRNLVMECFAPRFLRNDGELAVQLQGILPRLSASECAQLFFVAACRANSILGDFVREVYWTAYASGRDMLSIDDGRHFVVQANQDGRTKQSWSESTLRRVASYLIGSCCDFGLLERGSRNQRKILPFRIEPRVAVVLAYQLHYSDVGDNLVVGDPVWSLFGMERTDVVNELKRLALQGYFLVQIAGGATRIEWPLENWKELIRVFSQESL